MTGLLLLLALLPGADPVRPVDFDSEIVPVLTKAGCNAGACHGAAAGRGGFHLSLLGGDATADYEAIVDELEGRRINLARPAESLLLAKGTGSLVHGGGTPLKSDPAAAERVLSWIGSGARRGKGRRLTRFEVSPSQGIVEKPGAEVPLRATARFDDGPDEDVTHWTAFASSDPAAVEIDGPRSAAIVQRRGRHVVIARFLDRVVPVQLTLPLRDQAIDLSGERRTNFIDEEVLKMLALLRLPPSQAADDAVFLRRVRLDLTGRLPSPEETRDFVGDRAGDKRTRLVDRLLRSEAFADLWTLRFATALRIRTLPGETQGARAYHEWLREQIGRATPLDQVARTLLTATGDSHVIGPANFARMAADARGQAELVSQAFLGTRLQCANCHNHPLDRWTQDDYHGLAAVFARLERGREVKLSARGGVTNLRTGEPAIPRIPGERNLAPTADGREELAAWLTAPENRYFARATVNRLWQGMLGRGLVEPVDDLRDTNPATHPELLDRLAADFIEHGYDIRHTLRLIALSETYGRRAEPVSGQAADDRFYAHAYRRPLDPEVLADAIADVTGVADRYGDEPAGTRAVALFAPSVPAPALDILGRCSRAGSCEGGSAGAGLAARLHLLNGELINRKIAAEDGRLHRLIAGGRGNAEIIAEFHLRSLGGEPSPSELAEWLKGVESIDGAERTAWLEDFVWSLLNCKAFVENR